MDIENHLNRLKAVKEKLRSLISNEAKSFGKSNHSVSEAFAACSIYTQFFNDYKVNPSIVGDDIFSSQFDKAAEFLDMVEPEL